jgi:hypothetical protein
MDPMVLISQCFKQLSLLICPAHVASPEMAQFLIQVWEVFDVIVF